MNTQKTYTFYVQGMHCNACTLLTESELMDMPHISRAKASLSENTLEVEGDFGAKDSKTIAEELTGVLSKHGYTVTVERQRVSRKWSDFKVALPVALGFGILFVLLQKAGLVNLIAGGKATYGTAFVIGIVASLSSCMAVVGGLLLSMSATFAKEGNKVRPQILFHVGRILSFLLLGGLIGAIGSAFKLTATMNFAVGIAIGLVMLVLGLNLLDVFPWTKRLLPSMPRFMSSRASGLSKYKSTITPFLVGIITFFLPCGFTQSMQLVALSTGSFFGGGMTMIMFALGTLPVLSLISFSSLSVKNSSKSGIFFKSAGLIVIMFALFNIINSMAAVGLVQPLFNF